ncbi:MAG: M55 family metallopeptidase [Gammaproteobacteria bacterium]
MSKYLISVDIEGITGVVDKSFADLQGKHYELAKRYMLSDVNAVVEGILSADPEAEIIVRDAHGAATNLDLERLHPKASLVQGWGSTLSMVYPCDSSYAGVFLVGYHAGGHNLEAVLAHTYSSMIHSIHVNDLLINETGIAALHAGFYNVPAAFISGDDETIREAKNQLKGHTLVAVTVKESLGRDSALSISLNKSRELLSEGAKKATINLQNRIAKPFKITTQLRTEIKMYNAGYRTSIFARIANVLAFDTAYQFDRENFVIRYKAKTAMEMLQRLTLIAELIYGSKAFG